MLCFCSQFLVEFHYCDVYMGTPWWQLQVQMLSHFQLFCYPELQPSRLLCPWQFSRQEYWSWLPFLPPGDLPDPRIKLRSLTSPTLVGGFFTTSHSWDAICVCIYIYIHTHKYICMYIMYDLSPLKCIATCVIAQSRGPQPPTHGLLETRPHSRR